MTVRRFVVAIDETSTKEQRDAINSWLKDKAAYWHWIGNVWFLVDSNGKLTAQAIRDEINKISNRKVALSLVIQIDGDEMPIWSAFGVKDRFKWFHTSWVGKKAGE